MRNTLHIILADDDPDDCFIFSSLTREISETIKITCLSDCQALLHYLENNEAPDIIFLDLNMPILSGQERLKKIKERIEWKLIPIVIYSTATRMDIIRECYELGARLYIIKPNDSHNLRAAISAAIRELIPA